MWLLLVTVLIVAAIAAVWLVRRARGAHHPDRGPSRTGRVTRPPTRTGDGAAIPPDPGDARPAGPDAEAMGVPEPGRPDVIGEDGTGGAGRLG